MVALLVLLTLILFITIDYFASHRKTHAVTLAEGAAMGVAIPESPTPHVAVGGTHSNTLLPPAGVFLTRTHQWVRLLSGGMLRIGVDPLQVKALGTADKIKLPKPGARVHRGDPLATLSRQGRQLTLHAPVDGRIVSVNQEATRPQELESAPYRNGWLYEIAPTSLNLSFLERAFRDRDAENWLRSELRRLRDFLAIGLEPAPAAVLQDGGLPVHGFGGELDDAQWQGLVETFFTLEEDPPSSTEPTA